MVEVVLGALVRDDQVLLGHRRPDKHAYPDVWDLPGGVAESGEPELDTLTRELREELGVEIERSSASRLCRLTATPMQEPVLLSAWLVRAWHGTPTNAAPEEHLEVRWFGLAELPELAHPVVVAALRSVMGPGETGRGFPKA
jgi:8-oxo-dGTP pyrophosphatase MutT (NUDIX family)